MQLDRRMCNLVPDFHVQKIVVQDKCVHRKILEKLLQGFFNIHKEKKLHCGIMSVFNIQRMAQILHRQSGMNQWNAVQNTKEINLPSIYEKYVNSETGNELMCCCFIKRWKVEFLVQTCVGVVLGGQAGKANAFRFCL